MAILAADFKLAEGALANLDNFAKGIAKTGTASEKSQSQLKSATTGLKEFVAQVKALQTPFQQMIALSEKGGKEWVKYKAALKEASVGAKQLQADYVHLISAGGSWKATLDGIYSSQARSIINSKAEVVAAQNLEATFNKQIATRAQIIGLKNGSTQASLRALAVDEAELAITKAKYAADVNSAKQLAVNTILASNETLEIKRQALALAGIPPIKMAVVKATEVLTVAETGYTAAAVKSAAQATKQGMALELLSAQSKKRSALLSQLNALENGYAASLAKSLAPLQARVALSQAKNAADINLAKQIVLNTILASNETLEIKRQALALAGIPPIKMAVVKATQAMAVSSAESAVATNAASTAAQRGTGAFTTYGSAVRGAAGALGMLWFAYGQLLPLMAAFATVSATLSSFKAGTEFEYTVKMIQTLSKDVEGAEVSVADLNEELLHMEGLRHGPLELAKGMKEFAKAGVAPKDALRDMATMSKFATIAEMDLGEAIKKVIGLTLAFKPTMEAATGELFTFADAANMTAAAAMLTITDVDEMANAFAYAAELGVVSGMKFQEVAAALGIMANAGIRGTKGATSLRMGMIKLQTATDPVLKRIGDLTEEFTGIRKEFNAFHDDHSQKNIIEIFRDLNEVLKGLPDKERVAIFTDLFTARSLRAGAVISQQVEELESFIKKLEEAAEGVGFIEEKYQDLAQTAKAEWDFMKVAFQQMMLAFSVEGLGTDVIGDLLSGITAGIKEMTPAMQELGSVLGSSLKTVMEISKELVIVIKELNKFAIGGLPLGDLGLIGYILFRSSPQAAAIVAFLWAINEALKVFGKDAKSTVDSLKKDYGDLGTIIEQSLEVLQGKRDWNTGALKSTEGLAVVHERFKALDDTLAVSHEPIVSSLTAISDALEAFYGYEDIDIKVRISATISAEAQALLDKLFPEIKDKREFDQAKETLENLNLAGYFKDMPGGYEEALKRLKESTPEFQEQKKAIEESNRAIKAHNDEIQGIVYKYLPLKKEAEDVKTAQTFLNEAFEKGYINAEELASALDAVKKSTTAYRTEQEKLAEIEKIRQEYRKWEEKYDKEQADLKIKRAKALRDIYEELSETSPDMTTSYIAAQREAVKQEMQILKDELKIDDDLLAALEQKRLDEVFIKAARASNDFFLGVQAGFKELGTSFDKLGELGYQAFYDLKDAFHETFFKALKGDFDEIADLWKALLNKMLDRFLNFLADLLTNWTMNGLESLLFGSSGSGGIAGAIGSAIGGGLSKALGGTGGGGLLGGVATSVGSTALGAKIVGMLGLGGIGAGAGGAAGLWGGASLGAGESFVLVGSEPFIKTAAALETAATAVESAAVATGASSVNAGTQLALAEGSFGPSAGAAGSMAWMAPAAVAAIGFSLWASFVFKKKKPTTLEIWNKMGLQPEDFAEYVGDVFRQGVDLAWGGNAEYMATAGGEAVSQLRDYGYYDEFTGQSTEALRAVTSIFDETTQSWKSLAEVIAGTSLDEATKQLLMFKNVMGGFGNATEQTVAQLEKLEAATGIEGLAEHLVSAAEQAMTPLQRMESELKQLGVSGSDYVRSMELIDRAMTSATGSTAELEKYLQGLGLTEEQITSVTQHFESQFSHLNNTMQGAAGIFDQIIHPTDEFSDALADIPREARRATSAIEDLFAGALPSPEEPYMPNRSGGPIGYAPGGLLRGGSGVRDDLYLGTINGRPQVAMGGEYIVNKKATQKNLSLLEAINAETYAVGGMTPVLVYVKGAGGGAASLGGKYMGPAPPPVPSTKRTATGDNLEQLLEMLKEIDIEMGRIGKTDFQNELDDLNRKVKEMAAEAKKLGASEADLMNIRIYWDTMAIEMQREHLEAQADFMQGITDQIADFGMTDTEKAIRDTVRQMEESIKAARELGISEFEIAKIRKLQQLQEEDILRKHREAQADFMQGIRDQISEFGMTDTQKAIQATVRQMEDAIEAAIELGLAESEIAEIRRLQQLQAEEILRKQREAQQDFMQDINDQIASFSLTPMENELLANQRAMEAALKSATELELGESDLAKIRTLYGLKAQEIMNKGLQEGLDALKSFKESMAGVADEAIRSSLAQKRLFDVLSQARAGDFSGVEKIADILKDISIDKSSYATALDYARDYWKTMNAVSELERLTEGQLEVPVSADTAAVEAAEAAAEAAVAAAESSAAVSTFIVTAAADTAKLVTELRAIKDSIVSGNVQLAKNTSKAARLLERWEAIGMPDTRAAY